MKRQWRNLALMAVLLSGVAGCEKIGPSEHGVIFRDVPRWVGGGMGDAILQPGTIRFLWPWETIYRVETADQSIEWGKPQGGNSEKTVENYVQTRTLDGNEVELAITVVYAVVPEKLPYIVQRVGVSSADIRRLVSSTASADVRIYFNHLRTQDFKSEQEKNEATESAKKALNARLNPEGILVKNIYLVDFRFERSLPNDQKDDSYQRKIDLTEARKQETDQELKRVRTVIEEKRRKFNEAQARVNRMIEEAEGVKRQAELRGEAYYQAKTNEAEQIRAVGLAEVAGLKKQIEALSGPGGKSLLRLAIARELAQSQPKFVLLNSSSKNTMDIQRMDTNDLIRQLGLVSAMEPAAKSAPTRESTPAPQVTDRILSVPASLEPSLVPAPTPVGPVTPVQ